MSILNSLDYQLKETIRIILKLRLDIKKSIDEALPELPRTGGKTTCLDSQTAPTKVFISPNKHKGLKTIHSTYNN